MTKFMITAEQIVFVMCMLFVGGTWLGVILVAWYQVCVPWKFRLLVRIRYGNFLLKLGWMLVRIRCYKLAKLIANHAIEVTTDTVELNGRYHYA